MSIQIVCTPTLFPISLALMGPIAPIPKTLIEIHQNAKKQKQNLDQKIITQPIPPILERAFYQIKRHALSLGTVNLAARYMLFLKWPFVKCLIFGIKFVWFE